MPIRVECPQCRKSLSAPDNLAGTRVKCPACGSPLVVPPPDFALVAIPPAFTPPPESAVKESSCRYCGEAIKVNALKCKHCGEYFDERLRIATVPTVSKYHNEQQPSPGVAAVLSLVIPGAGQMYQGKIGVGFLWLLCVSIGYLLFIFPGLVLHILCVVMAASSRE